MPPLLALKGEILPVGPTLYNYDPGPSASGPGRYGFKKGRTLEKPNIYTPTPIHAESYLPWVC